MKIIFILVQRGLGPRASGLGSTTHAGGRKPRPDACGPRPDSSATSPYSSPLHEAVVMTHHELRLDLLDRVHRHTDHDEQRCATEVEVDAHAFREPHRKRTIERGADAER